MRRLFIIRKDLGLSSGKLAAMVGHCAEAYWSNLIKAHAKLVGSGSETRYVASFEIAPDVYEGYLEGLFVKTVCEAKSLSHLLKAREAAKELGLKEGADFGLINDACLTELVPENEDGTCTVGIWFKK